MPFDFSPSYHFTVIWDDDRHAAYFASYDRARSHYRWLISEGHFPVSLFVIFDSIELASYDGGSENER